MFDAVPVCKGVPVLVRVLEGVCDVVITPVAVPERVCVEDTVNTRDLDGVVVCVQDFDAVFVPDFV